MEFGLGYQTLAACIFCAFLIPLAAIDFEHQILPDELTLPLLWSGLFVNAFSLFTSPASSVLGAIIGYGILWLLYHLFKALTKKEGLGYGDLKLLAAIGAWTGWEMLPPVILLASGTGILFGLFLKVRNDESRPFAFGPFLGFGGGVVLLYGTDFI